LSGFEDADIAEDLAGAVRAAASRGEALEIIGGGTKRFYGRAPVGSPLRVAEHHGIVDYEPSELVLTARAGTPIEQIEALLAQRGQMLGFEPLLLGPSSTLGGVVASGLAGARRPFAGAVRDFILGVKLLDGQGRVHRIGGTVFKNVAGFDAFRLMAGAMGCLGVILEVSLRLAPRPEVEATLSLEADWKAARSQLTALLRRPTPLTGAMHDGRRLILRLSGARGAVQEACAAIGGEAQDGAVWERARRMELEPLRAPRLWRLRLPRARDVDLPAGEVLRDWAGGQVWLAGEAPAVEVRAAAAAVGGHAALFRGAHEGEAVFEPLPAPLMALHRRLKAAFDPAGVFNPGRMYEGL
jgi:glycolate oxidase FAD binding subunit